MKSLSVFLILAFAVPTAVLAAESFRLNLAKSKLGELPAGWVAAKTGQGPGSEWKVVEDATAPGGRAIAQTSDQGPNPLFNLCIDETKSYQDVVVAVSFKAVAGKNDQGGGPVWRFQDANNYYVARMNPLEDNYRVYKVINGKRTQLGSAEVKVPSGEWHRLRIVQKGVHIQCYLDGKLYLDVKDSSIPAAGKVGLWTKSDAQTHFAAMEVGQAGEKARSHRKAGKHEEANAAPPDAHRIGQIVGVQATTTPDGVVRVAWPRKDVQVQIDGVKMHPFMGLGSWAAFQGNSEAAMLMGDTVVFEDEVNPVIDAAFALGLEVTAIHNHFFFDEPKVYFMHIGGEGEPGRLAAGVRKVWDTIKQVRKEHPQPVKSFTGEPIPAGPLDAEAIAKIVGSKGEVQQGMVKITLGRNAEMNGISFGGSMGLTTWAGFAGSDALALVDGDFAMTAAEVGPVLLALRKAGINVVALHNHMLGEEPPIYFTHFWGKGKAADLAQAVRHALDAQKRANP